MKGLLVMHYGTPATLDAVLPYYTHIRHGRPPSQEQLDDLVSRYQAIGGPSPLAQVSQRQAEAIHAALQGLGVETKLYVGTKHTTPFIGEVVQQMVADGVTEAVGLVLAPHYSTFSVAAYRKAAYEALGSQPMKLSFVERWGALPEFVEALATRVSEAMAGLDRERCLVIFSAHSLPKRILAEGDPYQEELLETSRLVAERAGVSHWTFAFQSASTTGEPWLEPDILDVIGEKASEYDSVVACTVGFVSDHLEVLYDLGIEARDKCAELGLEFRRAATIGDDPAVMRALAGLVKEAL